MITPIPISSDMILAATKRAVAMGELNNSITSGQGNLAGFVGEEMVRCIFPHAIIADTYDYDIDFGSGTADVKTKRTTVCPKPHYDCSIADYNTTQCADHYIFCRVMDDCSLGWVLGFLPKQAYFDKARFLRAGEVDPANNYIVKADCWNVAIDDLWDIQSLPDHL